MTGIEKIIEKIENDCQIACETIISKAQAEAQVILENAQITAENEKKEILEITKNKCKTEIELAVSRSENERKKAILEAKINIINELIKESMKKLKNSPQDIYFDKVKILIKLYAQKGNGVLYFSRNDLNRIPQNFEAGIEEMLKGSEKLIIISDKPVHIDGGFIISYDNIEQNCTFDALLNSSLDEIKDDLYQLIFTRENI